MNVTNVNSNDILLRNICCLGDEIKIIDFGLHTIFGRTIQEVLSDLHILLSQVDKSRSIVLSEKEIDLMYNKYYPNWQQKLEKYGLLQKKYQEIIRNIKNRKKINIKNETN